jgi:hypothetical protein
LGDLVRDYYLYQYPKTPLAYPEPAPATVQREDWGGAYYLANLAETACSDLNPPAATTLSCLRRGA